VSCGATGVSEGGAAAGIELSELDSGDGCVETPGAVASPFAGADALESGFTNTGTVLVSELCDEHAQHTSATAMPPYAATRPNEDLERMGPSISRFLARRERRLDELRDDCDSMHGA
jgi:hypothetical protein